MTSKEIFLQSNDDVKFMLAVVKNPIFERALIYAKQTWLERTDRTTDPILAINQFLDSLRDLPIDEPVTSPMPRPPLHHDLDVRPRLPKTQSQKKT